METPERASGMSGDKLYQQRAKEALPILVRQAEAGKTILYSDLAEEMGMPNARNLNYVLGSIGVSMIELSEKWGEKVPPIQSLVVNKESGLPGVGIAHFLMDTKEYKKLDKRQIQEAVQIAIFQITTYPRWHDVLKALSLKPVVSVPARELLKAAKQFGGIGESEDHRLFKEFIAKNPAAVGLSEKLPAGETEYPFPSADRVDVMFKVKDDWIAVEVKSKISCEEDILRGLFQCVKYKALIEAEQVVNQLPQNARVILALESELPKTLIPIRNVLQIEVVENIARQ